VELIGGERHVCMMHDHQLRAVGGETVEQISPTRSFDGTNNAFEISLSTAGTFPAPPISFEAEISRGPAPGRPPNWRRTPTQVAESGSRVGR
jgi:hypothetical protein